MASLSSSVVRRAMVMARPYGRGLFVTGLSLLGNDMTTVLCEGEEESILDKISKLGGGDFNATLDDIAKNLGIQVQRADTSGIPTQVSYGFVCGYCSGLVLKKVGRAAAVVFGMIFMTLQTLQYSGYIQVDHGKLKQDMEAMLDLDKDGDVDKDDAQLACGKILNVLSYNLPAGSGFGAGFLGGLRSG